MSRARRSIVADNDDLASISGLPEELGIDTDLQKSQQRLTVRRDTRRYGKAMTIVSGFDLSRDEMKDVASVLKRKLACGGTVEGDEIELQGDHTDRVHDVLHELGYQTAE
jgi:translation initiation factor 1